MAASLDNLNIQISASTAKAVTSVNNLVKALENLKTALGQIDTKGLDECANAAGKLNNASVSMKDSVKTFKKLSKAVAEVSNQTEPLTKNADKTTEFADSIKQVAETTKQATKEVGGGNGNGATSGFQRFLGTVKNVAGNLKNLNLHTGKATNFIKKLGSSSKSTSISSKGLAKELLRVSKMMKLMITRMILRKIITGIGDGFKNLAQYSSKVNASMSLLWNSFRQLGNSIAAAASPLLNAFAPALNYIIQLVIKAVNAINQLISAMMGLGTWTRAKTLTDSYADSLKKAGGAAKELKKTVLGFDELNQLQDNNNSGGGTTSPANMFEEVAVEKKWKDLADKLLDPFKKAWARVGDYVKKSWKKALDNVKKLGKDVANDFLEVWNQPRTVQMLEDMLRIIGNIGQFVGNLANSFDKAWNKADTGKRIFENIRNLCAEIVAGIEDITLSWALWADKVNFSPLLESLERWTSSLEKPVSTLMDMLSDFNDHFVQPIATWLIEEGIPKLIDVFTDFNNKVEWDVIKERADRLWKALEPFAETIGEGLIKFIGDVSDKIAEFANSDAWDSFIDSLVEWMEKVDADDVANGLKAIATALLLYKGLTFLSGVVASIKSLMAIFAAEKATVAIANITSLSDALYNLAGSFLLVGAQIGVISEAMSLVKGNNKEIDEYIEYVESGAKAADDAAKTAKSASYTWGQAWKDFRSLGGVDIKGLGNLIKGCFSDVSTSSNKMRTDIEIDTYLMKEAYADANLSMSGELKTLEKNTKDTTDSISKSFDKDKWTFSGVADGLQKTFEDAKNAIKGVWNGIADKLNGSHSIGGGSFNINLPRLYATGGFPEDGLFMANHNELVGRFSNGKTAVANNEQITTGIAQAVYSAMMASNSGGAQYINNTIEVDGVAIARAVTKGQRSLDRRYSPTMA